MGFETPKIPRSYNEQKEMPKSSEAQRVASLARVLLTHQSHIQIYSREGKYLFQGCLNDCIVAWKSGSFDDPIHLGGIADRFGESIIRFGPGDDHGFVDRRWIQPLFEDLYAKSQGISERAKSGRADEERSIEAHLTWEKTELGFSGSLLANGKDIGHFSVWTASEGKMYIHDIQIGYDENAPRGKGIGLQIYKQIIEKLRLMNLRLVSTDFRVSKTSISPQALRVWEKLEGAGYARRTGVTKGKVYDRFGGKDSVEDIPLYEST